MVLVKRSVMIAAPVNQVWLWLVEPEKYVTWNPHVRFRILDKKEGGVGTSYHTAKETRGGLIEGDGAVTEWVENRKYAFRMAGGRLMGTYTLEPTHTGCKVSFEEKLKLKGLKGKIIWALFLKRAKAKNIEKALARLKSAIERSKPIQR